MSNAGIARPAAQSPEKRARSTTAPCVRCAPVEPLGRVISCPMMTFRFKDRAFSSCKCPCIKCTSLFTVILKCIFITRVNKRVVETRVICNTPPSIPRRFLFPLKSPEQVWPVPLFTFFLWLRPSALPLPDHLCLLEVSRFRALAVVGKEHTPPSRGPVGFNFSLLKTP